MVADIDLLVVQEHTVDSLDRRLSGLRGLIMDETVALGAAVLICGDLARQHVTESCEGIVEGLVEHMNTREHPIAKFKSGCLTLLSFCSSRFLMKMLPWPVLRKAGSR